MDFCKDGDLFVDEENIDDDVAEEMTQGIEKLSQECFYGRTLGFQVVIYLFDCRFNTSS